MNPVKITAVVLLISLMFHTGLQVNVEHLRAALRNYSLLARALFANLVAVPIFGVLMVRAFHLEDPIAAGVLLMAISPGVPFVVLAGGRKKGGSLGFAVELAFLLPAISVITVPITARLVLPAAEISASSVVLSLVAFQLLPLLIGMFVNGRWPAKVQGIQRVTGVVVLLAIVALLVLLGPAIVRAITTVYGSYGMWAALCVILLSLLTGWLLGGPEPEYRRTLAIGTTLRNIGLAAVIASTSFTSEAVGASVITYLLIQMIIAVLAGTLFKRQAHA
jgi:BASS family bile acid:Na+ symporter